MDDSTTIVDALKGVPRHLRLRILHGISIFDADNEERPPTVTLGDLRSLMDEDQRLWEERWGALGTPEDIVRYRWWSIRRIPWIGDKCANILVFDLLGEHPRPKAKAFAR